MKYPNTFWQNSTMKSTSTTTTTATHTPRINTTITIITTNNHNGSLHPHFPTTIRGLSKKSQTFVQNKMIGTFAGIVVVSVGLYIFIKIFEYYFESRFRKEKLTSTPTPVTTLTSDPPAIGGPFSLFDHWGSPVTNLDFKGRHMLLYFGFTHCPDVCPTELLKLAKVYKTLEEKGLDNKVAVLFVSIDPKRDTVEQLRKYLNEFHPKFIGLTGTSEQVLEAAKAYRVYSQVVKSDQGLDKDYNVDHTIFTYFMDPNGNFLNYFGQQTDSDLITKEVLSALTEKS